MRPEIDELVDVTLDCKVKPPSFGDAGLPDATGLVILLGSKRRVTEVTQEKGELSVERALDLRRGAGVALTFSSTSLPPGGARGSPPLQRRRDRCPALV